LTLGVLIVTGGTLAALPFRRSPAIPDASLQTRPDAVHATGPLESALEIVPGQVAAMHPDRPTVHSVLHQEIPGLNEFMGEPERLQDLVAAAPRGPNNAARPLTYEDLMAPIVRPQSVQDRFQAIASVRDTVIQNTAIQNTAAETGQPQPPTVVRSESETSDINATRRTIEFEERFASVNATTESRPSAPTRAAGTLASSMLSDAPEIPQLPGASTENTLPARRRHWIVQP
jgi:hypothetical protein